MLEFIKENISWIKDLVTLIFAGTATIIGVLTYKRARKTFLQPIRNEVIKKQSELLVNLLDYLRNNEQSFEKAIDYLSIVQVNTFYLLRDYGFIFKGQKELFENIDKEIVGWIPCGKSNIIKDVEIIVAFDRKQKNDDKIENLGKKRYEDLKQKIIDIEKIYQTKNFQIFLKELSDFSNNPFMPKPIQRVLDELITSINHNIIVVLKEVLEKFLIQFSEEYFKTGSAPKFNPVGIYNDFNHKRIHHRNTVLKLRNEIRNYLLIDEPW